jgi:serine/threonine protein phosphatase PrpC
MDNNLRIDSASISDRGLSEKRPQNEDSFLEMNHFGIFAVADGVGGAQAGEVASQMAVEILGEAFSNQPDGADAEEIMRTAVQRANTAIHQMAIELPQLSSMATTLVALQLSGNIATIGHVGDSRLYRVDRDGELYRETDDHSMVADEVRAGRMTEEQAENHPSRNIISRALGAEATIDVDLKTIMVEPGTAFLICSDGITRHVGDQEIKGVLTFGGEPLEICEYLKTLCYERGAEDNLTAVVIKVREASAGAGGSEAGSGSENEDLVNEEPTVATARQPFAEIPDVNRDEEVLELDTRELRLPDDENGDDLVLEDTDEFPFQTVAETGNDEPVAESVPVEMGGHDASETTIPANIEEKTVANHKPVFSMFGDPGVETETAEESPGTGTKIISGVLMLLLGGLIGLGAYHLFLLPISQPAAGNAPLSEMKSENIEFSSFEKNRRNVDADPAAYLKEVPPPEDAEDFYLIGRANLLIGDFPKARLALIEAQKHLATAEPANGKILIADIATALVITNDPTLQNRLKIEIGSPASPAVGTNANWSQ